MRFILKALFWFGVVVVFLPANEQDSDRPRPSGHIEKTVPTDDALAIAKAVRAFCTKNRESCAAGPREILDLHKAASGDGDAIARLIRSEAGRAIIASTTEQQ